MIVRPVASAARTARKGFTLVELLAVMAIIMVLAGLGAFAVANQMQRAKVSEAKIEMGKIESAAKQYYAQYGQWPTSVMELVQTTPDGQAPILEGGAAAVTDPWEQQYQLNVQQDEAGSERVVLTTTNPRTGQQLIWPQQ